MPVLWIRVPTGAYVFVTGYSDDATTAFHRDPSTGHLTVVDTIRSSDGVDGLDGANAISVSADGLHLYVASVEDEALAALSWDGTAEELSLVGVLHDSEDGVDGLNYAESVAVSPDGLHLYVASSRDDGVGIFERDAVTGQATFVGAVKDGEGLLAGLGSANTVIVSPDGNHVYVAARESALTVFRTQHFNGGTDSPAVTAEHGVRRPGRGMRACHQPRRTPRVHRRPVRQRVGRVLSRHNHAVN